MMRLQRRNVKLMLKLKEVIRKSLRFLLFDDTCSYCHKKLDREGYICSKCLEKLKKEAFLKNKDEFYYLFIYEKTIRQIISDYKLRNRKDLARDIAFLIKKPIFQLIEREKIDIMLANVGLRCGCFLITALSNTGIRLDIGVFMH